MTTIKTFFQKKKILLFSPEFFGYGQAIAEKLSNYGAEVDYFDERPGNDFFTKALIRIDKSLLSRKIHNYYDVIIKSLQKDNYDYVLFLNLEAISEKDLFALKAKQAKAKFIMYMWDSVKNKKHTASLLPYFDLKHTFDRNDSMDDKYDSFNFRPLFYLDEYQKLDNSAAKGIDLLFVGTIHSDRYELLMEVERQCLKMGKTVDFFMFFQSEKLFYSKKASKLSFAKASKSDFHFTALPKEELVLKLEQSKAVLDIQHPSQTGLTMRTIEMIGAQKKLITTNQHIKEYDFYDSNNIHCIDRENIVLNASFFETPYRPIDAKIYYKYAIDGWLEEVFSIGVFD